MGKKTGYENNKNYKRVISKVRKWADNNPNQVVINELNLAEAYTNGCIYVESVGPNTCSLEIVFFFDYSDPNGDKEEYPVTICFSRQGTSTSFPDGFEGHYLENALLNTNIISKDCEENTFLQMLPLLLDAIDQGYVKQYYWSPRWLCILSRFRIKEKYFYLKKGAFVQIYHPKYFRRRPTRIVSYEPWF